MAPTTLPLTFQALAINHDKVEPTTSLDGHPPIPIFVTIRGEYVVKSKDGSVEGLFVVVNVMTIYTEGHRSGTAYDGQQIFTGTIQGKKGSVSMRTRGTHVGEYSRAKWDIIPETATGELNGISGTGTFVFPCTESSDILKVIGDGERTVEFA